jgi:hypothetical protein
MAARAGIEPVLAFFQACADAAASEIEKTADAQIGAQKLAESSDHEPLDKLGTGHEAEPLDPARDHSLRGVEWLREIISAWPKLSPELRAAALAMTRSAKR